MRFIDLQKQYKTLKKEIDSSIQDVLNKGSFIMGKEVAQFEAKLAKYTERKNCITCANGTDALQLLYMAYGIGLGDAIFCPDVTFIATIEPACMLGATPVFCDIDLLTYNICTKSLKSQIKAVIDEGELLPKAVVVVDFLGNPCNYDSLEIICKEYGLILIEDAAQSIGAEFCGKKCGSFGHSATTSFFPAKPLGCYGDGGAILTDDDNLANILQSLRVHGKGPGGKYDNIRVGVNSRLDTIQAAILLPKLKALQEYEMTNRQIIAKRYNDALKQHFVTPHVDDNSLSVYAQYAMLAEDRTERDFIVEHLNNRNIPNMVYYPTPLHMLPVFKDVRNYNEDFNNSTNYCARTLSLPMHPYLNEDEQERIVKAVLEDI